MLGAPLSCLSVLIPHPAGAVWAPWPGAALCCQALLVLAVPRVMQHFFPEPLGNGLAFFPFLPAVFWLGWRWVGGGCCSWQQLRRDEQTIPAFPALCKDRRRAGN